MRRSAVVERLRGAGCVFAEDEADLLIAAAPDVGRLERLVADREAGMPLEWLLGFVELAGRRLAVPPGVFVPRQRTAWLAALAREELRRRPRGARLVELCCGVAPVATLCASAVPALTVDVVDVDPVALRAARRNLPADAGVWQGDLYAALPGTSRGAVDVVAAVPPYIPAHARGELPRDAVRHEPAAALFGGTDGLDVVRRILAGARDWVRADGVLLVEVARVQQGAAVDAAERAGLRASALLSPDGVTAVLRAAPSPPAPVSAGRWGTSKGCGRP